LSSPQPSYLIREAAQDSRAKGDAKVSEAVAAVERLLRV
jgi:hypothetical protein